MRPSARSRTSSRSEQIIACFICVMMYSAVDRRASRSRSRAAFGSVPGLSCNKLLNIVSILECASTCAPAIGSVGRCGPGRGRRSSLFARAQIEHNPRRRHDAATACHELMRALDHRLAPVRLPEDFLDSHVVGAVEAAAARRPVGAAARGARRRAGSGSPSTPSSAATEIAKTPRRSASGTSETRFLGPLTGSWTIRNLYPSIQVMDRRATGTRQNQEDK